MSGWSRRIRAAIGMGLTWAAAWFGVGMLILLGMVVTTGSTGADVPYPIGFGALGFAAGVSFSVVLGLIERRRRFDQMSLARFASWGAIGGFLLSSAFVLLVWLTDDPTFLSNFVGLTSIFTVAGAGSATGALLLARKAQRAELPRASDDTLEIGSSGTEGE